MTSQVEICNLALSHIKSTPISDLLDSNPRAQACRTHYDFARRAVLRQGKWQFARKRVLLAAEATAPAFGQTYSYLLPSDLLRLIEVYYDGRVITATHYQVEDRRILTDLTDIGIQYLFDNDDGTHYDPIFIYALSHFLASMIAPALTGKSSLQQEQIALYRALMGEAKAVNNMEARHVVSRATNMTRAQDIGVTGQVYYDTRPTL